MGLKIPLSWVNEAKVRKMHICNIQPPLNTMQAIYALDNGRLYDAYEFYLAAGLYDAAHDIAVLELAPDAVIRQDLMLIKDLFDVFDGRPVANWNERGKAGVYLLLETVSANFRSPERCSWSMQMLSRGYLSCVTV